MDALSFWVIFVWKQENHVAQTGPKLLTLNTKLNGRTNKDEPIQWM